MTTVFVLANSYQRAGEFVPELARVGTLPVMLRSIIIAEQAHADRIVVCCDSLARRA